MTPRSSSALWIVRLCLAGLCALGFLPGCDSKDESNTPYKQAMTLFTRLEKASPERCYLDPRMGKVETLLKEVSPGDSNYETAQGLLKRIQTQRVRLNAPQQVAIPGSPQGQ